MSGFGVLVREVEANWWWSDRHHEPYTSVTACASIRFVPEGHLITIKYSDVAVPIVMRRDTMEEAMEAILNPPHEDLSLYGHHEKDYPDARKRVTGKP